MVQHITDSNFDELVTNSAAAVVDFSATWCGPCRALAPIIDELSDTYDGRITVCKADVEEAVDIAERFGIRNIPTVLFFKNGQLQENKIVGAVPKSKLVAAFDALLA